MFRDMRDLTKENPEKVARALSALWAGLLVKHDEDFWRRVENSGHLGVADVLALRDLANKGL